MSTFDLSSMEEYDSCAPKISQLFDLYGLDTDHEGDQWYGFKVKFTLKKCLNCTKNELLEQFKKAFVKMNAMARHLKDNKKLTQVRKFKMSRVIKSSHKRCYTFNISFLMHVLK